MGNVIGAAAWLAALKPLGQLESHVIFEHVQGYLDKLEAGLLAMGFSSLRATLPSARSGILSVKPPDDVSVIALHGAIDARRVSCSTPDGQLRFSPHWPNAHAEVDAVLAEVSRAVASLRG